LREGTTPLAEGQRPILCHNHARLRLQRPRNSTTKFHVRRKCPVTSSPKFTPLCLLVTQSGHPFQDLETAKRHNVTAVTSDAVSVR